MRELFEIATQIRTPLALSGFVIAVLFGSIWLLLKKGQFAPFSGASATRIFLTILKYVFWLAILAMLLGFAGYVIDSDRFSEGATRRELEIANRTVRVDVKNVPLKDALRVCADQAGAVLAMSPEVQGTISINARGRLADVVDEICTAYDCDWRIKEGRPLPALVVLPKGTSPSS